MSLMDHKENKLSLELLVPYLIYTYVLRKKPSVSSMDNRILWQKVGYLAKQLGMPLNSYQFNWYIRGPYSPAYTSILYSINENIDELIAQGKNFSLTDSVKKGLEPLVMAVEYAPSGISETHWLELLASVHFIKKNLNTDNKQQVFLKLIKEKPHYNIPDLFNEAWKALEDAKLF
ncbi:hypothetical protein [Paenibacillus mesotrionivorans]|uniref:Uncharacterized protein n=1 Tax=Paenibacillus mesotrionivorans TaxID=3160968 RepID=A0ACC7NYB2_9BACL